MIDADVLKKIKHIQIYTKRAVHSILSGDHKTSQKGFGMDFDQLNDYQYGDDIRLVDWKSSARSDRVLIKQYADERTRRIIVIVDVSASYFFGSGDESKQDVMMQIAGVLALVGQHCKDHVGLLLVSDQVEYFIPPRLGKRHIHTILNTLFSIKPKNVKTDLNVAFQYIARSQFRNALVFVVSDFIAPNFKKALRGLTKRHDILAIRCTDSVENGISHVGFVQTQDIETGMDVVINTAQNSFFAEWNTDRIEKQNCLFHSLGIHFLDVIVGKPFIENIILFLRRRRF